MTDKDELAVLLRNLETIEATGRAARDQLNQMAKHLESISRRVMRLMLELDRKAALRELTRDAEDLGLYGEGTGFIDTRGDET